MDLDAFLVELCCDGQTLEAAIIPSRSLSGKRMTPRDAAFAMSLSDACQLMNHEEDYFRVTERRGRGGVWYWHYRDGVIQRLLRPPVSPGSLPPSP